MSQTEYFFIDAHDLASAIHAADHFGYPFQMEPAYTEGQRIEIPNEEDLISNLKTMIEKSPVRFARIGKFCEKP
ncbi:MAG: hypothetical protein KBC81_01215 [Candidatus Pacebacteria bacterium]|nr:hypothetical protein [Candidatus Paceibacterota bacterium]